MILLIIFQKVVFFNTNTKSLIASYRNPNTLDTPIGSSIYGVTSKAYKMIQSHSATSTINDASYNCIIDNYAFHDRIEIYYPLKTTYANFYFPISLKMAEGHKIITIGTGYDNDVSK
jgi:hypothetical protein